MNRGLIEARPAASRSATARELPRFMNRGLIEAATAAIRALAGSAYFPDS